MNRTAQGCRVDASTEYLLYGLKHQPLSVIIYTGLLSLLFLTSSQLIWEPLLLSWMAIALSVVGYKSYVTRTIISLLPGYQAELDQDEINRINNKYIGFAFAESVLWSIAVFILLRDQQIQYEIVFGLGLLTAGVMGFIYVHMLKSALVFSISLLLVNAAFGYFFSGITVLKLIAIAGFFTGILWYSLSTLSKTLLLALESRNESHQKAEQAHEENYVFNQHWQNTPLAAIEWDMRFKIASWNPSAESIFGYTAEEALGKPLELIFDSDDLEATKKKWRALWRRKVGLRSIHKCRNKQGETVVCEWHDAAIMRNGQSIGISSFVDDITAQTQAEETIKKQANYDSLTNLPNRRYMMSEIKRAIHRCERENHISALVFLDLDHFKDINDTQGHDVGDIVLKAFAERISAEVRNNDLVARFGGDEFVVLLENLGSNNTQAAQNVKLITDKFLHLGAELCRVGGIEFELDVSGGIVLFDGKWDENEILKKADLAMYRVKNEGRKGMAFYDESLSIETEYRVELIRGLRHGLENNEFDLHYQPILDNQQGVVFSEALLRWIRPYGKVVPAGHFIEIMANSPMMGAVGYWIIDRVCQDINSLMEQGVWKKGQAVFVNISPKQLMDVQFAHKVRAILDANQIPPHSVVLEITEDSLIHNYDEVLYQLRELIDMGIRLALDDFGTGYSSLAMLKDLPVHFVKLDREFVRSLFLNQNNYQIVNAIVKLCEILGLKVIAEGVEEMEQFEALKKMSCDFYQGFVFNRPMPLKNLVDELLPAPVHFQTGGRVAVEHLRLVE